MPEDVVRAARVPVLQGRQDGAFGGGATAAVGAGVVNQFMLVLAQLLLSRPAGQAFGRGVDERHPAVEVEAVDTLGRGIDDALEITL